MVLDIFPHVLQLEAMTFPNAFKMSTTIGTILVITKMVIYSF